MRTLTIAIMLAGISTAASAQCVGSPACWQALQYQQQQMNEQQRNRDLLLRLQQHDVMSNMQYGPQQRDWQPQPRFGFPQ